METKDDRIDFPIRPYGKTELAWMYCGKKFSEKAARRWLSRELKSCPGLMEQLQGLGYQSKQRTFTRSQVRVIFEALGEPS